MLSPLFRYIITFQFDCQPLIVLKVTILPTFPVAIKGYSSYNKTNKIYWGYFDENEKTEAS